MTGTGTEIDIDSPLLTSALGYVQLGTGLKVSELACGLTSACVVVGNGVKCWGNGENGKLGYGNTDNVGDTALGMGDALPFVALGGSECVACPAYSTAPAGSTSIAACKCVEGYTGEEDEERRWRRREEVGRGGGSDGGEGRVCEKSLAVLLFCVSVSVWFCVSVWACGKRRI